jgi:hypothetical protein
MWATLLRCPHTHRRARILRDDGVHRAHNGVVTTCLIGRHDADLNRQVRIDAVPFASFESFCLASGLEALREMMDHDARASVVPAMREVASSLVRAYSIAWQSTNAILGPHRGKLHDAGRPTRFMLPSLPSEGAGGAECPLGEFRRECS